MGGVAATILPRTAVKVALDAQGLYTGPTGERLESALGEWLDRAGYPRSVQKSGLEDLAFTGGAQPAGDVLWDLAQQAAVRTQAGAFGGTAAIWPDNIPMPPAPPHRPKTRAMTLRGLGANLTFEQKAAIGMGVALAGAVALGFGAGQLVKRAEPDKP